MIPEAFFVVKYWKKPYPLYATISSIVPMNIGTDLITLISMTKIRMIGTVNRNSTEIKEDEHEEFLLNIG